MRLGDLHQRPAAFQRQVGAGGVLVGRERVDELRLARLAEFGQLRLQEIDAHAVFVHRQAGHVDAERSVGGDGAAVGDFLADHRVARLRERLGDESDGLHRAVGERKRIRAHGHALAFGLAPRHRFAQRRMAELAWVLGELGVLVGDGIARRPLHPFDRKGLRIGAANGEVEAVLHGSHRPISCMAFNPVQTRIRCALPSRTASGPRLWRAAPEWNRNPPAGCRTSRSPARR